MSHLVEWMVERGDGHGHTQRFSQSEYFSSLPLRGDIATEDLTIILEGFHGRKLQHVTSATYLVESLTHAKTRLGGDELGKLLFSIQEFPTALVEDFKALIACEGFLLFESRLDRQMGMIRLGNGYVAYDCLIVGVGYGNTVVALNWLPREEAVKHVLHGDTFL